MFMNFETRTGKYRIVTFSEPGGKVPHAMLYDRTRRKVIETYGEYVGIGDILDDFRKYEEDLNIGND